MDAFNRPTKHFVTIRHLLPACICILLTGCQTNSHPPIVAEYVPHTLATQKKVVRSQVFVLWRWCPVAPDVASARTSPTRAASNSSKQFLVEIRQVYTASGEPIGFRCCNQKLTGIAGAVTIDLEDSHYIWTELPGSEDESDFIKEALIEPALTVVYYAGGFVLWCLSQYGATRVG